MTTPPQDLLTREEIEQIKSDRETWANECVKLCDMALAYLDTLADSKTPPIVEEKGYYKNGSLDMSAKIRPPNEGDEIRHMNFKCATRFKSPTLSAKDNKNEQ